MSEFTPVLITLPSLTPSLALEILPHGLTFHRFIVQADGRTHDLVIGPEAPEDHLTKKYVNSIVGRYANRIPVGTHQIERNGVKGEFTAQANESPRVSLHGGPVGFDYVAWELLTPSTPPTLFSAAELAHLPTSSSATSHAIFRLVSPDGDQGFPGQLVAEVLVALVEPGPQERKYREPGVKIVEEEYDLGSLVYVYRAKVDKGVTPINMTQHWGFNLEASLRDIKDPLSVKDHALTIKADRIVALDADSLHNGYTSVSSAPAHAHNGKKIGDGYPEKGYDDFYVFESPSKTYPKTIPISSFTPDFDLIKDLLVPSNSATARTEKPSPQVELSSEKSGLKLVFESNQSGAMFYSNGMADPTGTARKKIHGGSGLKGDGYPGGSAAFIEFHEILTAFLDPANKDKDDTLLTSDELYHNYVRCDVRFKEPTRS